MTVLQPVIDQLVIQQLINVAMCLNKSVVMNGGGHLRRYFYHTIIKRINFRFVFLARSSL